MVRKTRKHQSTKSKRFNGVQTIPELRRSFEHMENFINEKIKAQLPKDQLIKDLRKEWFLVFVKQLNKKSAEAFIEQRLQHCKSSRHRTLRKKGGANALGGAPINYSLRPGMYLAPESIPSNGSSITSFSDGHYPLSGGEPSIYGSLVKYVDAGFRNPEPGQSYDPVDGQSNWPIVPADMGSNKVSMKGGNRKTLRKKGGSAIGSFLSQAFKHPISSSSPPSFAQDMQDMSYGKQVGASPDQVQKQPNYLLGENYPKVINFRT
jgi:hypothetical protein